MKKVIAAVVFVIALAAAFALATGCSSLPPQFTDGVAVLVSDVHALSADHEMRLKNRLGELLFKPEINDDSERVSLEHNLALSSEANKLADEVKRYSDAHAEGK